MSVVARALDELYGTPPEEFTKTRTAIVRRLEDDGDAAASARLRAARKPTLLAYVLNQLARRQGDDVARLVDVGRDLARAQRKALREGSEAGDLRDAIARQREVVRALTTKTAALMRELGVSQSGHLDEVAGALQAALVDPAVGAALEEGRLDKTPEPATGFPGAALLGADASRRSKSSGPSARTSTRAKTPSRDARKAEAAKKAAAVAKARATAEAAEDARRVADELFAEASRLSDEAKRLATEARDRAKEAARARRAASSAQSQARAAARAAGAA